MPIRGRFHGAIGFGYLCGVGLLAATLVVLGCVLDRVGGSSTRLGAGYDAAVVALVAGLLRPVDLVPAANVPSPREADTTPPADEPA